MNKICENCGKEHDGSYGSGRFCSKSCRCSAAAKKVKNHSCHFNDHKPNHGRSPYGTWKCIHCGEVFETRAQMYKHSHDKHPDKFGHPWNKGLTKETSEIVRKGCETFQKNLKAGKFLPSQSGKPLSKEHREKVSKSMIKAHEEGRAFSYYKLGKVSYPEQYWLEVFESHNVTNIQYQVQAGRFILDFANIEKKVYFEVDGDQHYRFQKSIEHDKLRTEILDSQGWKLVSRCRWGEFRKLSNEEKDKYIMFIINELT